MAISTPTPPLPPRSSRRASRSKPGARMPTPPHASRLGKGFKTRPGGPPHPERGAETAEKFAREHAPAGLAASPFPAALGDASPGPAAVARRQLRPVLQKQQQRKVEIVQDLRLVVRQAGGVRRLRRRHD